ncbi:hypothetical protein [Halobacillus campisalis]|uniref:Uncharacterized protein n=1 Tax=Halobacillus campisalis TaxID=435909 RepID=A0ABW2K788_9BACI|nr:hypothetical protein [Halobacillus campisalis]
MANKTMKAAAWVSFFTRHPNAPLHGFIPSYSIIFSANKNKAASDGQLYH